mmetsp:Transcript_5710/g.12754  ORF Transcript_5710/g.12754 Transcript_5710/m.12754 type:complete len:349 (+) Transcript_5710:2247-3293(+)
MRVNLQLNSLILIFTSTWVSYTLGEECLRKAYQYKASKIRSDGYGDETTQDEISGIAISTENVVNNETVMWVISDSGSPHVVAFGVTSGKRLASVSLENAIRNWSKDWEGLNIGPCDKGTCLYVMDTGNNKARETQGRAGRDTRYVYRFREPILPKTRSWVQRFTLPKDQVDVIAFMYRENETTTNSDSEASFLDPLNQDLYIITKWDRADQWRTRTFRIPGGTKHGSVLKLEPLKDPSYELTHNTWSRGDMSKDGTMIALGAYGNAYFWRRLAGETVQQTLARNPCYKLYVPPTGYQHESIGFGVTTDKIYQVSEGYDQDLWETKLVLMLKPTSKPTTAPTFEHSDF